MMQHKVIDAKDVVIRFAGDSGDGMQLTGSLFADMSAIYGNGLSTFPDYPAEIRAPHGTVSGVSGFQVHIGSDKVSTPGDFCDLLNGETADKAAVTLPAGGFRWLLCDFGEEKA